MPTIGTRGTVNINTPIFPYSPAVGNPGTSANHSPGTLQAGATVSYLGGGVQFAGHTWSHVQLLSANSVVTTQFQIGATGSQIITDGWIFDDAVNWSASSTTGLKPGDTRVIGGMNMVWNGSQWQFANTPAGATGSTSKLIPGGQQVWNGTQWVARAAGSTATPQGGQWWSVSGSPAHATYAGKDLGQIVPGSNPTQVVLPTDGGRMWALYTLGTTPGQKNFMGAQTSVPGVQPPPNAPQAAAAPAPTALPPSYTYGSQQVPPGYTVDPSSGALVPLSSYAPPAYPSYPGYPTYPAYAPAPTYAAPAPTVASSVPPGYTVSPSGQLVPPGYGYDPSSGAIVPLTAAPSYGAAPIAPSYAAAPLAGTPGIPAYDPVTGDPLTPAQAAYQGAAAAIQQATAQQQAQAAAQQQAAIAAGYQYNPSTGQYDIPPGYGAAANPYGINALGGSDALTQSVLSGGGYNDPLGMYGMAGGIDPTTLAALSGGDPDIATAMALQNGAYDPTGYGLSGGYGSLYG